MTTHKEVYNDIIYLIETNKLREAQVLYNQNIRRIHHMNNIVYLAFNNNKFDVGKELIKFNFIIRNQGYEYNYSPFDFFCHVCKNDYIEILFKIIEDPYFWNKDRIIFEPLYQQTPKQWLIATASYILCNLNKVRSLELLCDKYNITKFDADQTHFFKIASKNNFEELLNFLINRYGSIIYEPVGGVFETSLYDVPCTANINNKQSLSVCNPMYLDTIDKNNIELKGVNNPIYGTVP
jgi:hypothetical protein